MSVFYGSVQRFHLPAFLGKVIIQGFADPPGFGIGEQLRKALGTYQPSEKGNDQRFLDRVFINVVFHDRI